MAAKTASVKTESQTSLSLEQQENLHIKGPTARNIVMQKLLRKSEVTTWQLTNAIDRSVLFIVTPFLYASVLVLSNKISEG